MPTNPILVALLNQIKPDQFLVEKDDINHSLSLLQQLHTWADNFNSAIELLGLINQIEQRENQRFLLENPQILAMVRNPALAGSRNILPPQNMEQWSREMFKIGGWQLIVGRDAGMTIWHFQRSLDAFNLSIRKCPTVFAKFDRVTLRRANKLFQEKFSYSTSLRHAIAHAADQMFTLENQKLHQTGEGAFGWRKDGAKFSFPWKSKAVSIEVTTDAHSTLENIVNLICHAWEPALK